MPRGVKALKILGIIGLGAVAGAASIAWVIYRADSAPRSAANPRAAAESRCAYIVDSAAYGETGIAGVTYTNQSGGSEQRDVSVPWLMELTRPSGASLYVSAQKQFENRPYALRVAIRCGALELQTAESTSPYGIATASGVVP